MQRQIDYRLGVPGALAIFVLWTVFQAVLGAAFRAFAGASEEASALLGSVLGTTLFLGGLCLLSGRPWRDLLAPRNALGTFDLRVVAVPLVLLALSDGVLGLALNPHVGEALEGYRSGAAHVPAGLDSAVVLVFLATVIAAPLAEELVFRGIMLHGLLFRYSPPFAIALSALLFAFAHLDVERIPNLFLSGCLLGWLYHVTRSIIAPSIVHGTHNLLAWQLPFVAHVPTVVLVGVVALALVVGLWAIVRILERVDGPHWRSPEP